MKINFTPINPFPNRPTDESEYCYPHFYHIEFYRTYEGYKQRHVWRWNSGKLQFEEWIPSSVNEIYLISSTYSNEVNDDYIQKCGFFNPQKKS